MIDIRQCFSCGKIIHYRNFLYNALYSVQKEHFTPEMIDEIWDNPIFVIKCCNCFYVNKKVIHEFVRSINNLKKELISW